MSFVIWFSECGYNNKNLVGGKNASLGELKRLSLMYNFSIADGFAITTKFYDQFITTNNLEKEIQSRIDLIDYDSLDSIERASIEIKELIMRGDYTVEMNACICENVVKLQQLYAPCKIQLAIRSSAVAEDMPNASFAGQQDTYLNIVGVEEIALYTKRCIASLFNSQVISYRHTNKIAFSDVKLSIGVQKMVRSDLGSAGVAFSLDPETGYNRVVVINSSYGLGESVVSGHIKPDEIEIDKRMLKDGVYPIISKRLGNKTSKTVYGEIGTREVETVSKEQESYSLSDSEAVLLARYVVDLETRYSELFKRQISVDVEWAIDGHDNRIYILQTRPETVHSNTDRQVIGHFVLEKKGELLIKGVAVGEQISTGEVCILDSIRDRQRFKKGDILVTDMTTPDWEPIMKLSGGIVTNKGGRTCHAAIIARELGINAIVGTDRATSILKNGQLVTLCCSEGSVGNVYMGKLPYHVDKIEVDSDSISSLPVKLMLNVGNPETAFNCAMLPNDGVGLVRMEFTISNYIKIHPLALIKYDSISQEKRLEVMQCIGTSDPVDHYVNGLCMGIGKIASSFYPKEVIVRFSDFKSNEYRNLIGGDLFEPEEENPMIGWRGCSRYYSDEYREAFGLECKAISRLRDRQGLDNIVVMLPFCRTPEECKAVLDTMEMYGLKRAENGLKVYIMCEIPSNVLEAKYFAPYIDGVSIGGNDLLQLTLGVDRDSGKIANLSDHTNRSYRKLIKMAINRYKRYGIKVGFCGQQPSESPEFAKFLMDKGIDSISVIYDTVIKTIKYLKNQ